MNECVACQAQDIEFELCEACENDQEFTEETCFSGYFPTDPSIY